MKKPFLILFLLFVFSLLFSQADFALAEVSPDGCMTWNAYCTGVGNDAAVYLSWQALAQADINEIRSGCTLQSVTYAVEIVGEGTVGVGSATSYTWQPLEHSTEYDWRVRSNYQCTVVYRYGTLYSNYYSFTTPMCNLAPNKPSTTAAEGWNYCSIQGAAIPTFEWTYSDYEGDPQTAYEIRIGPNAGFPPTPGPDEYTDSGGASTAYTPVPSTWTAYMQWDHHYWWIVRVKDGYNWSEWSNANPFDTPLHAYPWPGFTWTPEEPSQGEVVVFDPEESGVNYFWTITQGDGEYTDSTGPTNEEPHIKFSTTANKIKLRVTDAVPYSCESAEQEITAQLPLPEYEEIPPIIWLKKTLAGVSDFFSGLLSLNRGG